MPVGTAVRSPLPQDSDTVVTLLAQVRQHTKKRGEVPRPLLRPEPTRYLHAKIPIRLVPREWHWEIVDEGQQVRPAPRLPQRQVVPCLEFLPYILPNWSAQLTSTPHKEIA